MNAVKRVRGRTTSAITMHVVNLIGASFVVLATIAAAPIPARAGDDAIVELLQTSAGYWNSGRLDDFMKSYERSPATTYIGSKNILHGYDAIRAHYASAYTGSHVGTLSFSDLSVRPLGDRFAVVVARWHLALRDGSHPSGIFSLVLHRGSAGWHIITDHSP